MFSAFQDLFKIQLSYGISYSYWRWHFSLKVHFFMNNIFTTSYNTFYSYHCCGINFIRLPTRNMSRHSRVVYQFLAYQAVSKIGSLLSPFVVNIHIKLLRCVGAIILFAIYKFDIWFKKNCKKLFSIKHSHHNININTIISKWYLRYNTNSKANIRHSWSVIIS